ncbi:MAG: hypothetical protein ABI130_06050 [Leifsonia sp.]
MTDSQLAAAPVKTRFPAWAFAVTAASVVIGLIVGAISFESVLSIADAPRALASQYLSDVVAGHVQAALRLDGTMVSDTDPLLTDAAYKGAEDRISGFSILSETVRGVHAQVSVRTDQVSGAATTTVSLLQTKGRWHLLPVSLDSLTIATGLPRDAIVRFGGAKLLGSKLLVKLWAFPGSYDLEQLSAKQFYTLTAPTTTLTGFGRRDRVSMMASLTDAGRQSIEAAAKAWLSDCAAQGAASGPTCPFGLTDSLRSGWLRSHWLIQTAPTFSVSPWSDTCDSTTHPAGPCWSLDSNDFTVSFTGDKAEGTYTTGSSGARIYGWVNGFSSTGALFNADPPFTGLPGE